MEIHLDLFEGRIHVANRYRKDVHERLAVMPGANFATGPKARQYAKRALDTPDIPKGCWTLPWHFRTCLDLRTVFHDETIVIGTDLWEWAEKERKKRLDLARFRAALDYPTPRVRAEFPRLDEAIHNRPFQAIGVAFSARARWSLNGDEPGLGKTLQAAATAVELGLQGPIIVVAPAAACTVTWPDEFDDWLPGEEYVVAEGDKATRNDFLERYWTWADSRRTKRSWLFINSEMLQTERKPSKRKRPDDVDEAEWDRLYKEELDLWSPDLRRHPALFGRLWTGAVIDEAQRILPTKSSLANDQTQQRSGAALLNVRPNGYKMALSGTPMRGNPLNLWGTLNWLMPQHHTGYWTYVNRWFDVVELEDGRYIEGVRPSTAREYGEELDAVMIRRTKQEVAPHLPRKEYAGTRLKAKDIHSPVGIWLPMEGKQASAYQEMVLDAVAHLDSGAIMGQGILAEMTRCRQMSSAYGDVEHVLRKVPGEDYSEWVDRYKPKLPSNKWDWVHEFLTERGVIGQQWGEDKIVIASWQTPLLNLIRAELERLRTPSLILTGATRNADRRAAKATFQRPGGPRVFLLNTYAGGVSLTLDAADDMIVLNETWSPDDQTQVEDRIHRIGRVHKTRYWYLRSRGTIEEHIATLGSGKDRIQKDLMDGRRGVDFAKRLLTGGVDAAVAA